MAPYIVDLHNQIKQLYEQQQVSLGRRSLTVYRGQRMIEEEFKKLTKFKNTLLSFNCFLSTSKSPRETLEFARLDTKSPGYVGVIFVIKIDASLRIVPYADIQELSEIKNEAEVLFSMHSIFKVGNIGKYPDDPSLNLHQVELHLTDEDDPTLIKLRTYITAHYGGCAEHRLGQTLLDMGEYKKAEEIYLELLETTTEEEDKGVYNHELGLIKMNQCELQQALEYYEKTLEIERRILPENDPSLATTLNQIGVVYHKMKNYSKALKFYEESLEMRKKTLPENHPEIATSYGCIGLVYSNMDNCPTALTYYQKSLQIKKKTLPENHPNIAASHHNMGCLFYKMKDCRQAIVHLKVARQIRMISLPPTHADLKETNTWIESVEKSMK